MPTPIEKARNLAELTGAELRAVRVATLEDLQDLGWEEAFLRVVEMFPERLNLNMAAALIGAELGVDWRKIPVPAKDRARRLVERLRPEARR